MAGAHHDTQLLHKQGATINLRRPYFRESNPQIEDVFHQRGPHFVLRRLVNIERYARIAFAEAFYQRTNQIVAESRGHRNSKRAAA